MKRERKGVGGGGREREKEGERGTERERERERQRQRQRQSERGREGERERESGICQQGERIAGGRRESGRGAHFPLAPGLVCCAHTLNGGEGKGPLHL